MPILAKIIRQLPEFLLAAALMLSSLTTAFAQSPDEEEWIPYTDTTLIQAVRLNEPPFVDTRVEIIKKLLAVKRGELSPENFYKEISQLEMPPGKELRHTLMEIKKDIGNYQGEAGLRYVFGDLYDSGGSSVEKVILVHRKQVVMDMIHQAIEIYAKTDPKFSFYYGEVGGWPDETPEQMKFAGDIDFNFLSGDLDAAMALKKIFEDLVVKRYGRTPEELDIPCTVHGLATGEVYVGKHGQAFAEDVTKSVKKISFGDDGKPIGIIDEDVDFEKARTDMVLEAEAAKVSNALPDLKKLKWPNQPGISLEMIRHFEHDIAGKNVFTDLESFVKAAKYAERSFRFLAADLGDDAVEDKRMQRFTEELVEHKKNPKKQVELIRQYYEDIGKPLPFEVDLAVQGEGKSIPTIRANEKLIRSFWEDCRQTMWQSANAKIRLLVDDFQQRIRALDGNDAEAAKALYAEIQQYHEMLEIEDRILSDDQAGLHGELDRDYKKLISEFRDTVKQFKQKVAKAGLLEYIDPQKQKTYQWIEEMLKGETEFNARMAGAALLQKVQGFNDILDYLDDTLLNRLRYGEQQDYRSLLRQGQRAYWSEAANQFLKGTGFEFKTDGSLDQIQSRLAEHRNQVSDWFNRNLESKLDSRGLRMIRGGAGKVAEGIQSANNAFNRSVSGSTAGQTMMTGMMVYNLADELPAYMNYVANDDWEGLAAEFFKRRVPFGSAVERGVMGDYYGVGWELTATLIPPVALASAAKAIGESVALGRIDAYFDEEMQIFIDRLYEDAEFKIAAVETVGEDIKIADWDLLSVSYNGVRFDFSELMQIEVADAREMGACLQQPSEQRAECFPMDKMSNGLFEWWRNRDAFEQAFRKTDPWIQLIVEMKAHPNVGPKLDEHFRYQLYTRLEQIKVEFLKTVKQTLEERRAGEQSIISGSFPKMVEELLKITESLDIRPQLEARIADEFGGEILQFMTWIKDYIRGISRELRGEVDVWDVYEELSAFVTRNLSAYQKILKSRAAAIAQLPLRDEDQGLRILTGPYFLTGEARDDQSAAKKWESVPAEVEEEFSGQMRAIKKEAGADPSELELGEGTYDQGVLEQLKDHGSYREMWKQVNSQYQQAQVADYLGNPGARQANPNGESVMSDQDRALKRFKLHAQRIEEILEAYRQHYAQIAEEEAEEVAALSAETSDRLAEILAQMQALTEKAQQVSGEADQQVESFKNAAGELDRQVENYEVDVSKAEQAIQAQLSTWGTSLGQDLSQVYAEMQRLSERLAEHRDAIELYALSVCEAYETIQAAGGLDRAEGAMQQAKDQINEVRREHYESQSVISQMKRTKVRANNRSRSQSMIDSAHILVQRGKKLSEVGTGLTDQAQELIAGSGEMDALTQQAAELSAQAQPLLQEVEGFIDLNKDQKKTVKEIDKLFGRIASAQKDTEKSAAGVRNEVAKIEGLRDRAENLRSGLEPLVDDLDQKIIAETEGEHGSMKQEIDAMYEAGMLFAAPINEALKNANTCFAGTTDRFDRVNTPENQVASTDCSSMPGTQSKWNNRLNRAVCACPEGGDYNHSLKRCEKGREQKVREADCSQYGSAYAAWNERAGTVECYCRSGYEWGSSNRCVAIRTSVPEPAYDPYYDDPYYDDPYYEEPAYVERGGYGSQNSGTNWGDVAGALIDAAEQYRGREDNTGYQRPTGPGYDGVWADDGSSSSGGYGGSSRDCARNYSRGTTGLYGGITFDCHCPGWGFDPSRSQCVQGMDDRYDGGGSGSASGRGNTGITVNQSRSRMGGGSTGSSNSTSSTQSQGNFVPPMGCQDYPKDYCYWSGGHDIFGVPGLGYVDHYCVCGCDLAPDSRCGPRPN